MTQKKTFNMSLVWNAEDKEVVIVAFLSKENFNEDGTCIHDALRHKYIFIREIELEVEFPADFDPIAPQLAALNEREKQIKAKYQLDLTKIEHERQKLLAIENKGA